MDMDGNGPCALDAVAFFDARALGFGWTGAVVGLLRTRFDGPVEGSSSRGRLAGSESAVGMTTGGDVDD